jgi:lysophospholipase L1-like esterase
MKQYNIKVAFLGDSICTGYGVSVHDGWVNRVSTVLAREYPGVVVLNSSVNGRTTRQALEIMPYEIQSHPPDVLVVQFGMNDCNRWDTDKGLTRVSALAFKANMAEIIQRALTFGVRRIFVNTNHVTGLDFRKMSNHVWTYQDGNRRYNEIVRECVSWTYDKVAGDQKILLNDIELAFEKYIEYIDRSGSYDRKKLLSLLCPKPDLLHLSVTGHELYFKTTYPSICEAIRDVCAKQQNTKGSDR